MRGEEGRKNAEEEKVERQEKHALFFFQFVSLPSVEYSTLISCGFYHKCSLQYSIFDSLALKIQHVQPNSRSTNSVHVHASVVSTAA